VLKMREEYVDYIKRTNPENRSPELPIRASYRPEAQ
jgi:hypothetical protein